MELVTHAAPYRELMDAQIEALELRPGARIADLGSGVGAFPRCLLERPRSPLPLAISEVDYVLEGTVRWAKNADGQGRPVLVQNGQLDASQPLPNVSWVNILSRTSKY